jgi:hypothetical protein
MARYIKADAVTVPQLNTELEKIEQAIQHSLSRKGDLPNAMEGVLDMNSNQVINLPDAVNAQEPLTFGQYLLSKEESATLKDAVFVDSIKDLSNINTSVNNNVFVRGFYTGTDIGGGLFYWDPSKDKALHNGGTVLDPDRIAAWDGTQSDLSTLFTVSSGFGCFVLTSKYIRLSNFGASSSDSTLSFEKFILATVNNGWGISDVETEIKRIFVSIPEASLFIKFLKPIKGITPDGTSSELLRIDNPKRVMFVDPEIDLQSNYAVCIDFRITGTADADYIKMDNPKLSNGLRTNSTGASAGIAIRTEDTASLQLAEINTPQIENFWAENGLSSRGIVTFGTGNVKKLKVQGGYIKNVGPSDDGDGIVTATSSPSDCSLSISGTQFIDCEKRAFKHQGNGMCHVSDVLIKRTKPVTDLGIGGGTPISFAIQSGSCFIEGIEIETDDASYGGLSMVVSGAVPFRLDGAVVRINNGVLSHLIGYGETGNNGGLIKVSNVQVLGSVQSLVLIRPNAVADPDEVQLEYAGFSNIFMEDCQNQVVLLDRSGTGNVRVGGLSFENVRNNSGAIPSINLSQTNIRISSITKFQGNKNIGYFETTDDSNDFGLGLFDSYDTRKAPKASGAVIPFSLLGGNQGRSGTYKNFVRETNTGFAVINPATDIVDILKIVWPYSGNSRNGSSLSVDFTIHVHTRSDDANNKTSVAKGTFTAARSGLNSNAEISAITLTGLQEDVTGTSAGHHGTVDASRFSVIVTGNADENQVLTVNYSGNFGISVNNSEIAAFFKLTTIGSTSRQPYTTTPGSGPFI